MQIETLIFVWFGLSICIEVIGNFIFWLWLRRRGVSLAFIFVGTPGYLDYAYIKWCKEQKRSYSTAITLRWISLINLIVAAIVSVPLLIGGK